MMIDYFKAFVSYRNEARFKQLVDNGTFAITTQKINTSTGELLKECYAYKNMTIEPQRTGFMLSGSIHKYRSQTQRIATVEQIKEHRGFNGDLFTLDEVTQSIDHLCGVLDICPSVCLLQNIEAGLNVPVTFDPKIFLEGLLFHRNNFDPKIDKGGNYVQFEYAQYYLKLYNKGRQYNMLQNVLRVEVKVIKMRKLQSAGIPIETLNDINEATLKQVFAVLCDEFQRVMYYDYTTRTEELSPKQQSKANEYKNRTYWRGLDATTKKRQVYNLNKMILEFSNNLKGQIQGQMYTVFDEVLRGKNLENCTNFTDPENGKNVPKFTDPENGKNVPKFTDPEKIEMYQNLPFKYTVKFGQTPSKNIDEEKLKKEGQKIEKKEGAKIVRYCPVTGLSLEQEKEGAKYAKSATFLWLRETDPDRYFLICSELLPKTGKKPVREKSIISHLCKQVRNRYRDHNRRYDRPPLQKYYKNQLELFYKSF